MNYTKAYQNLMSTRLEIKNVREESIGYFENHHIVPRCMGGTDQKDNIVRLTAREHFIAHALLVKMYPSNRRITNAFLMMKWNKTKNRYINSRLFEQLKKYWVETHSGQHHHMYKQTHSVEARKKISEAKQGTMPVRDSTGNIFCVRIDDPRVLSGELVHHSIGRKMIGDELLKHRQARQGFKNPNANSVTDTEIVTHAIEFYNEQGVWCKKHWIEFCKLNKLPIAYSTMRFDGGGYNELLRRVEKQVGPLKKISKSDYASKVSKTLKAQQKRWYHNPVLKQTKLLRPEEVTSEWTLGRKLKWD